MRHAFPPLDALRRGETLGVEYKRDLDAKNKREPVTDETIAESLMALGNADGGYLLLGVENTWKVLGIHPDRSTSPADFRSRVSRKFLNAPPLATHEYREDDWRVFAFYVEAAKQNPYQLQSGSLKIRKVLGGKQGPENIPFPLAGLPQWQAQRGVHYDFSSQLISDIPWGEHERFLNPMSLDLLQRRIADGKINNPNLRSVSGLEQQMDTLGLLGTVEGRKVLTHAALILFGSNEALRERIPAHAAQFQAFAPDGSLPYNLFSGQPGLEHLSLLLLATRIEELFRGIVPRRELMDGLFRIDIPAFGDDALREAVMNAFIHRDYTIPEPVIIQITPDQFTITNPGGFYRDVTPQNILFHEPCSRNQRLAQACADIGLMEKSGRGVDRIFWDQIRFLRPMPSYAGSTDDTVRLVLSGGEGSLKAIRWMLQYFSDMPDMGVRVVHGGLIHALMAEGEASRDTLIAALPGLGKEHGLRAITELINAGLITRIGHGRGQRLILSAQFQKDLGMPEAFVYQAGLDRENQQQMILRYVEAHGYITRQKAARLLRVPADDSVYKLLHSMVKNGLLAMTGTRATARYSLPKA